MTGSSATSYSIIGEKSVVSSFFVALCFSSLTNAIAGFMVKSQIFSFFPMTYGNRLSSRVKPLLG
jgi:hypothetical protein